MFKKIINYFKNESKSSFLDKMIPVVTNFRNFIKKNNFGLNFGVAYILFDVLATTINPLISSLLVFFGIILMEFFDKYKLKEEFNYINIIAGILGLISSMIFY